MGIIKEFNYPDVLQRKHVFINSFISFLMISFIAFDILITLNQYYPYEHMHNYIFLLCFLGISTGNLAGFLIFRRIRGFRKLYIFAEIMFILSAIAFVARKSLFTPAYDLLLSFYILSPVLLAVFALPAAFFAGIKICYFVKISCGEFIDNRKGTFWILITIFTGMIFGCLLSMVLHDLDRMYLTAVIPSLMLVSSIFIIKMPFTPHPVYAREREKTVYDESDRTPSGKKASLFFTYLNFSYIILYLFMGNLLLARFYGDIVHIKLVFFGVALLSLSAGLVLARKMRAAYWFIYTEMVFPLFFLVFMILIHQFNKTLSLAGATLLFIPVSLVFGFSLKHSIRVIQENFDHAKRFNIINFSLFILPVPIIIALSFLELTTLLFHILLYLLFFLNIVLPGLHLMQRKVKGYKTAVYFAYSLVFIPLCISLHLYYEIPLGNSLFITNTRGFDELTNINYNSDFITKNSTVHFRNVPIFTASDEKIKGLMRSALCAHFFNKAGREALIIDGNQKFFRNPVFGYFESPSCIDYMPPRLVDYKNLPLSGSQKYVCDEGPLVSLLMGSGRKHSLIADFPNLWDQTNNAFRFSDRYLHMIRNRLAEGGIFAITLDVNSIRPEFLAMAMKKIEKYFSAYIGFLFGDHLIILASDSRESFRINSEDITLFSDLLKTNDRANTLFYSAEHFLSHMIIMNRNDLIPVGDDFSGMLIPFEQLRTFRIPGPRMDAYFGAHDLFLQLIPDEGPDAKFRQAMTTRLKKEGPVLSTMKKIEVAEAAGDYETETENLFSLKKKAEYDHELRAYLNNLLDFKEDLYFNTAQKLEKQKNWSAARRLYLAVLAINKNSFEANYQLGILNITVQKLDEAFTYLQQAMKLNKDNPKVLYQLGVLLFASGRPRDAVEYLKKALALKENTAPVFLYLGLCYEQMGNLADAKTNYQNALLIDPNDNNIINSLDRIRKKIEDEQNKWKDSEKKNQMDLEKGVKVPLPIIDSAIKKRLTDEEAKNMEDEKEEQKKKKAR